MQDNDNETRSPFDGGEQPQGDPRPEPGNEAKEFNRFLDALLAGAMISGSHSLFPPLRGKVRQGGRPEGLLPPHAHAHFPRSDTRQLFPLLPPRVQDAFREMSRVTKSTDVSTWKMDAEMTLEEAFILLAFVMVTSIRHGNEVHDSVSPMDCQDSAGMTYLAARIYSEIAIQVFS